MADLSVLRAGAAANTETRPFNPDLAARIDAILLADRVPGAAISLITPDGVFEHFHGTTSLSSGFPIGASTGYQLCSVTKAYVATLALVLEQQGICSLDDPVAPIVPELAFQPEWLTGEINLRDLLSNRIGVVRGGLIDFGLANHFSYDEIARRIGHARRTGTFRGTFSYCNAAFNVAVLAMQRITSRSLGDLLDQYLFQPLGMQDTSLGSNARNAVGRARAHTIDRTDAVVEIDEDDDWVRPGAGGLLSSARDQQRWLRLQLGQGEIDGVRYLPQRIWRDLWRPHVSLKVGQREFFMGDDDAISTAYGLGWFLTFYQGRFQVVHTGGGIGWRTRSTLLPAEGIAVSVLLNVDGKTSSSIQNHIFDHCLGLKTRPWHDIVMAQKAASHASGAESLDAEFTPSSQAPLPASDISGRYRNPESGIAAIAVRGDALAFDLEDSVAWSGDLLPKGGAIFEHRISGPIATYDGPQGLSPRVNFTSRDGRVVAFVHSTMGEFARC